MNSEMFNKVTQEQIERSINVLCNKAKEYATTDRLHNFKVAAALQNKSPTQALAGMMAKHTVSVYDMCWSGEKYPTALWEEKITDSINYLLLLNALVREDDGEGRDAERFSDVAADLLVAQAEIRNLKAKLKAAHVRIAELEARNDN